MRGAVQFRALLAVLLAWALTSAAAAAAPGGQEQNAFTVTGPTGVYTRTPAEVAHWARIARTTGGTREQARAQAMQVLVSFAWLEGEAAEQGLTPSDEAVSRSFRQQRRRAFPTRRAFRRFLRQSGQTVADIRLRVRMDMLSTRIRRRVRATAEATVTDAQMDAYHARRGNVRIPERRDVRMVLTRDRESAAAAKRELLDGATWRAVARALTGALAPHPQADPRRAGRAGRARPLRHRLPGEVAQPHRLRPGVCRDPRMRLRSGRVAGVLVSRR